MFKTLILFIFCCPSILQVMGEQQQCRLKDCGCPSDGFSLDWCSEENSLIHSEWCNESENNCEVHCNGIYCADCLSELQLSDFEVWRREEGYWYGEYTLLGAEGAPFTSEAWNYPYDHYYGFIHIELVGNALKQRNVFVYPPQSADACIDDDSTVGNGVCGINGNEKVFSADQEASDCDGNLAGPYAFGAYTLDTTTTIIGDDTVVYSVKLPSAFGGGFNQNQLTTLPGNGVRVRTAQGFDFFGSPSYASFYRETKFASGEDFIAKLAEVRAAEGILESDYCAWDSTNAPSGITCTEHFGFEI